MLQQKSDVNILSSTVIDAYGKDFILEQKAGLNFAIGLVDFDDSNFVFDDPTYGSLGIQMIKWRYSQTSQEVVREYIPLSTHRCTLEELGRAKDKSQAKFYQTSPRNA